MKQILAFLIGGIMLAASAIAGTWMASPGKGSHASAVVGAWYDNGTFAATTTDTPVAHEGGGGYAHGGPITPTSSGNCTKVRVYFGWVNANGTCKAALYTTGGTLLSNGTVALASAAPDRFYEITLAAPQSVTASTTYVVLYMVSTFTLAQGRYVLGANGVGKANTSATYAPFPTSPVTIGDSTLKNLVGMWVE